MTIEPQAYPFPSRRAVTYGARGMVCASQPLAAQAGLDMLKVGGNAIDAALATAIALTVVEPVSNGIGGDGFGLIWTGGKLHGLNASGPAPMAVDAQTLRKQGLSKLPDRGWLPITVPGLPSGWASLSKRFGRLPFPKLFEPAIAYAEEGHPLSPEVGKAWEASARIFSPLKNDPVFRAWFDTFTPAGQTPKAGERWKSPDHAATLRELAANGCESFYRGALADKIDACAREQGGLLRKEDLAAYRAEWVEPISARYRGYDVWELPPNGHGIVALQALRLLEGLPAGEYGDSRTVHRQLEAMKLAFGDGLAYIADPKTSGLDYTALLEDSYIAARRGLIGETAAQPQAGDPYSGGTVYLCAADGEGNMVSWIQSNYQGFGSGIVIPGTGIALHDRGCNFSLAERHPNCIAPGKRPYHTIIPGFLTHNGEAVGPFGVMGAFMQPQGHVQVVMNTVDFHMNPQAALDAPRWQWTAGKTVELERGCAPGLAEALRARGHDVKEMPRDAFFGRGQIIWRDEKGVLCGGTEPRADGCVAAW